MLLAWIFLTLSFSVYLSSITFRLHPVSAQSCCREVLVGQLSLARPCEGVHWRSSFMTSSLLLQQCPTHLHLIITIFRTIVFIFIVISTTFRPICPPAFFRCLSNSGTFTELRTTSFILVKVRTLSL